MLATFFLHSCMWWRDLGGVCVEEGPQVLLLMPEGMKHISQVRGRLVVLILAVLLEGASDSSGVHGGKQVSAVLLCEPRAADVPVVLGPGWFVV